MLKRLLIFILIIGGVLYFALKDDNKNAEKPTLSKQLEERADTEEAKGDANEVEVKEEENNEKSEVIKEEKKEVEKVKTIEKVEEPNVKTEKEEVKASAISIKTTTTTNTTIADSQPAPVVKTSEPVVVEKTAEKELTIADVNQKAKVYLYDWKIDVSALDLSAGPTVFTVHNNGKFSHNFAIQGGKDFGNIRPGTSQTFIVDLPSGMVTFYSPKAADVEREMMKTISVR